MRGSLPPVPHRSSAPGAPANLTPLRHSGGSRAPLAMASWKAAAAPRSEPDAWRCLVRSSRLRRRLAATRAAPPATGSAELTNYRSRSRPVPSMPSATSRAARRRGAARGVAAGFSRQPRPGAGRGASQWEPLHPPAEDHGVAVVRPGVPHSASAASGRGSVAPRAPHQHA
ncbi:uncharacterized protein LOC144370309 [Ictidomys tridecemlineatus]